MLPLGSDPQYADQRASLRLAGLLRVSWAQDRPSGGSLVSLDTDISLRTRGLPFPLIDQVHVLAAGKRHPTEIGAA